MERKPLSEMLEALRAPVPRELVSKKDTGSKGFLADYINVTDQKDLIDDRIGAGNWSSEITRTDSMPELYIVIVRITVYGTDASCFHDNTGVSDGRGYGDIASNAYAQAFKRACESFGLARELWRGEEASSYGGGSDHNYPPKPQPKPMPANPLAKSVSELATPKQIVMIRAICRGLDIDCDLELRETMKLDCKVEELSRRAASSFIDHLKRLEEGNEVPIVRRSH